MISIEKCLKVLNKNKEQYTKEEAKAIRDLLYLIGHLDYKLYKVK